MIFRFTLIAALLGWAGGRADEIKLPPRPADAEKGTDFARRIESFDLKQREEAIVTEVKRGNVPAWWRQFVEVKSGAATISVAPDYLAVGSEDDFFYTPLTPQSAQLLADELECALPTRKMVDAIYRSAPLKLAPLPIPPSREMTTAKVFAQHSRSVRDQRSAAFATQAPGMLVAGHKKDVVLTPQLAVLRDRVAIYGWHRAEANPIQALYLGHKATWVDYSHGVRLVRRAMTVNGQATTIGVVLADDQLWTLLSDEGPMTGRSHADVRPVVPEWPGEKWQTAFHAAGVRAMFCSPEQTDPAKPTRLVLYALPAGNTIEQTIGRGLKEKDDDWHFNIQHIGAQTRWLRARLSDANLVVAYLECAERSWVLWRRKHPGQEKRIIDAVRAPFPEAKIVFTGHSAGGSLAFGYLDRVEAIPDEIERIAFLDSNYAYETAKGHDAKLAAWLAASPEHRLVVLAYQDYVALLDGKTFVSENGGTWGRSRAMLLDLSGRFSFTQATRDGLQRHVAAGGRIEFLLKENPEKKILHTVQVERNGFIHAMLAGTDLAGKGYEFLGARAYDVFIAGR
ncbi:MAG: hypothetical protein HZA93_13820 [Verrucomicrobia bacterium]|nr:hypothetical protein [Verrucomicrobiota bacterium]